MGDICDGDPDDMAAFRVWVRLSEHSVIVIARVRGIDGDQRQIAQIDPARQASGLGLIRLSDGAVGERIRDTVLVDRDQADRFWSLGIAQPVGNAGTGQAKPALWARLLGLDQFAVAGIMSGAGRYKPFLIRPFVDGNDASTLGAFAKNTKDFNGVAANLADQTRRILVIFLDGRQATQNAIPSAKAGSLSRPR